MLVDELNIYKEISQVPTPYIPNGVYFIRVGNGIDIYVANSTGTAIFKHNNESILISTSDIVNPLIDDIWVKKENSNIGELQFINGLLITYSEEVTVGASLKLKTESGILTTKLT